MLKVVPLKSMPKLFCKCFLRESKSYTSSSPAKSSSFTKWIFRNYKPPLNNELRLVWSHDMTVCLLKSMKTYREYFKAKTFTWSYILAIGYPYLGDVTATQAQERFKTLKTSRSLTIQVFLILNKY